ncbi:MAG: MBL fold metallo-hydrolase [Pseudomonadota bacterium]
MKITILGCGTSTGVPMLGCNCNICSSNNSKNKRTRSSVLIQNNNKNILIDTAPDLRFQAIANKILNIHAVLYTHDHADHTHGIDDLRSFNFIHKSMIGCYASKKTILTIKNRFSYIFDKRFDPLKPNLKMIAIDKHFELFDLKITPIPLQHGDDNIFGFRINNFAYLTDCSGINESSLKLLQNLELVIISGLRLKPHKKHFSIEQATNMIKKLGAKKGLITHLSHTLDYNEISKTLPENINLAYDGLVIKL